MRDFLKKLWLVLLVVGGVTSCNPRDFLSADDTAWLRDHEGQLEVLFGYECAPDAFYDEEGNYVGFLVDYYHEVERVLGVQFSFHYFDTWSALLDYSKTNRNFISVGMAQTESRHEYLRFTDTIVKAPYVIVCRQSAMYSSMQDLQGQRVCTVADYAVNDYLSRHYPSLDRVGVDADAAGLRAVSIGHVDAMLINQMYATYLIEDLGLSNLTIGGDSGFIERTCISVSIQDAELFKIIDKAVAQIGLKRGRELHRKWFGIALGQRSKTLYVAFKIIGGLALVFALLIWGRITGLKSLVRRQRSRIKSDEGKFLQYVKNSPVGIMVTDAAGNCLEANPATETLTGYPFALLAQMKIESLIDPEQGEQFRARMTTLNQTGSTSNEFGYVRRDGSSGELAMAEVILSEDRRLIFLRDILVRKQAEEERNRLERLESISVLAGGIAHDFNNMLAGFMSQIELAAHCVGENHEAYGYLDTAMTVLDRATNLTKQLLTFSKGGDPIKEMLSIGEVIVETAVFSVRGSKVQLKTQIATDLFLIDADQGQLSQVISNLCINAMQAMPDGGVLSIAANNHDENDEFLIEIVISDEGSGIAPEHREKIFEPYFSTKAQGNGLGLAVTHSIVTKHNGTIRVDSTLGKGTTFTIRLPASAALSLNEAADLPSGAQDSPLDVRVLVLDDESMIRNSLSAMLNLFGCEVEVADCGRVAMELYQQAIEQGNPFDVVIVDLTLPGESGGEAVARQLIELNPRVRLIVSSGYATSSVMANYREYGFCACIEKPFSCAVLRAAVTIAMESSP